MDTTETLVNLSYHGDDQSWHVDICGSCVYRTTDYRDACLFRAQLLLKKLEERTAAAKEQ